MQSDNYLDKDSDKTGHGAMKYSETHGFLLKVPSDVFINNSQVIWFDQKCIIVHVFYIYGLTLLHIQI